MHCAALIVAGKRQVVYGKTRAECREKLHELATSLNKGTPIPGKRETVATFLDAWLTDAKPTIRIRTWERYEQLVRVHIVPALGKTPLAKLEPLAIQRFYRQVMESGL